MRARTRLAAESGTVGRRRSSRRSGRPGGKLKPERVQLELLSMPGWRPAMGGNALARTRKFRQAAEAARRAAAITGLAVAQGLPIALAVTAYQVTVTLQRPSRRGIDLALIDLARQIG